MKGGAWSGLFTVKSRPQGSILTGFNSWPESEKGATYATYARRLLSVMEEDHSHSDLSHSHGVTDTFTAIYNFQVNPGIHIWKTCHVNEKLNQ